MAKEAKTNAMRMLERAKVAYTSHEYPHEEGQAVDGANVARLTGQDPARVFKTLVTQGADLIKVTRGRTAAITQEHEA